MPNCCKFYLPLWFNTRTKKKSSHDASPVGSDPAVSANSAESGQLDEHSPSAPVEGVSTGTDIIRAEVEVATREVDGLRKPGSSVIGIAENVPSTVDDVSSAGDRDTWGPLLEKVEIFASAIDWIGELHPYAKAVSTILSAAIKPIIEQNKRDDAMGDLCKTMEEVYDFIIEARRLDNIAKKRKDLLEFLWQQTHECACFLRDQSKVKAFYLRAYKNVVAGRTVDDDIMKFTTAFSHLKEAFVQGGALQIEIYTVRILEEINDIKENVKDIGVSFASNFFNLRSMFTVPAVDDKMDIKEEFPADVHSRMAPNKGCLPETRKNTLEKLSEWVNDTSQSRVLFLLGGAGTGKSAIAHTIARLFSNRLGAFFRFDRNHLATNQAHWFFSSIINRLANWDKNFRRGLLSKYKKGSFQTMEYETQWKIFVEAAIRLKDGIVGPVLIVIDALDESGNINSRKSLLHFLTEHAAQLPSNFRIFVTSRPERDINKANQNVKWMHLDDQKDEAKKDIVNYLHHELGTLPGDDLPKSAYEQLAEMADGLFQWAFTACRFMEDMGEGLTLEERFMIFFTPAASVPRFGKDLDTLYSFILGEKFNLDNDTVKKRFISVLGQILGAAQPLSCNTLHALCITENGSNINEAKLIVQELGSVLSVVAMGNEPIRPYHTSFRDFLTDENRSGKWYIDVDDAACSMALGCFHTMNAGLHFNLFNLPSSFHSNKEMLPLSVEKEVIAEPLKYACQFWEFHLKNTPGQSLCGMIVTFINENLLFWFEALSVLQLLNIAAPALSKLADLLMNIQTKTHPSIAGTISLLHDADKFLHYFGTAITYSAPHIYISALPFTPKCSPLAQTYGSRFEGGISLLKGQLPLWPTELARLTGHRGSINCIAFSHDGKRIVSGSRDKTIRIWDAETGQNVGDPLTGHTDW
ncbi:hypothetical protein M422DRAFT_250289, partial [Sphaerobolus stellatus SS14]